MIRLAGKNEYKRILKFYYDLIDDMQGMEYHPKWQKGIYPDPEELKAAVNNSELFIFENAGAIIAAMRINHEVTEGYEKALWRVDASKEEISVIHMLGVAREYQGKGIAKKMVQFAINNAERSGQKAIRLDVLVGNIPANRLYESMNFRYIDKISLFYEDTGITDFELYELAINSNES